MTIHVDQNHDALPASLFGDLADDATGVAGSEHAPGDVSRDDAAGPNDCFCTDPHPWQNQRAAADPHIPSDLDWLPVLLTAPQVGVHRVHRGEDLHTSSSASIFSRSEGIPPPGTLADSHVGRHAHEERSQSMTVRASAIRRSENEWSVSHVSAVTRRAPARFSAVTRPS